MQPQDLITLHLHSNIKMEFVVPTPTRLPTMGPATNQEIHGQKAVDQKAISKRAKNNKTASGRKKAVNSFVLFRGVFHRYLF